MSFTAEVRDELSRVDVVHTHCRKAELAALIRTEGTMMVSDGRYRLEIATENAPVARRVINFSHQVFGLKTELTVRKSVLHKTNNYLVTIPSQPKLSDAVDAMAMVGSNYSSGIAPHLVERSCCAVAYLRGAFLGGGFVSDPKGDLHFELTAHSEEVAQDLAKLMERFDIHPKVVSRRGQWAVYLKSAEPIVEFLARVGAHSALLRTENARVVKNMRSTINRRVNAEIANQAKTTNASIDQIRAIKAIEKARGIESLPQALQEFARLRLEYPECSLRELGETAKPPLSKSAVNHRMRRIEAIAAELSAQ